METEEEETLPYVKNDEEKKPAAKVKSKSNKKKNLEVINKAWEPKIIYNYYDNPNFSGERPDIVLTITKGRQSKLIEQLKPFKQWKKTKKGKSGKIDKEDIVQSVIGIIKEDWQKLI